jgi:molybdopterin synthase catalytic subunit
MTAFPSSRPAVEANQVLSAAPLQLAELLAVSHHASAGAVVLFSGDVRISNLGKEVAYLEFEAQEKLAGQMIREILATARQKWQLNIATAQHRLGRVGISECAVVVITASPHRREAYEANRYIMDRLKHEVPIWKCEFFTDGTYKWGGNCNCAEVTGDPAAHLYEFDEASGAK